MAECWRCPYTYDIRRRFGTTVHCNLELANMDVTYYCNEKRKNEENLLCPFINPRLDSKVLIIENTKQNF